MHAYLLACALLTGAAAFDDDDDHSHGHSHGQSGSWFVWVLLVAFFFFFICLGCYASWDWGSQHKIKRGKVTHRDKDGNVTGRDDYITDEHVAGSGTNVDSNRRSTLLHDYSKKVSKLV